MASLQWKWAPNPLGLIYMLRPSQDAHRLDDLDNHQALIDAVVGIFQGQPYLPQAIEPDPLVSLHTHKVKPMVQLALLDALVYETAYLATYPLLRQYFITHCPATLGTLWRLPDPHVCGLVEPYDAFDPALLWSIMVTPTPNTTGSKTAATAPYTYVADISHSFECVLLSLFRQRLIDAGIPFAIADPLDRLLRQISVTGETGLPISHDAASWLWFNLYLLPVDIELTHLGLSPKRSYDTYLFPLHHPDQLPNLFKRVLPVLSRVHFYPNPLKSRIEPNGRGLQRYLRSCYLQLHGLRSGRRYWQLGLWLYCLGYRPHWLTSQLIGILRFDPSSRLTWLLNNTTAFQWRGLGVLCNTLFSQYQYEELHLCFQLWQTLQYPPLKNFSTDLVKQWACLNE